MEFEDDMQERFRVTRPRGALEIVVLVVDADMKATPKSLKCRSLTVTTVKFWTAAVAAIAVSSKSRVAIVSASRS